jgi:hypothetical protein
MKDILEKQRIAIAKQEEVIRQQAETIAKIHEVA